jgi:threonine dehydrogenase-like Zn-dependent dehydrogenase
VGLALATRGSLQGMTVLATTRDPNRRALLEGAGVDHVLFDDGEVADKVRAIVPGGVDGAVELVGVNVRRDTLRSVRRGGTACFTGILSDQWTIPEFCPHGLVAQRRPPHRLFRRWASPSSSPDSTARRFAVHDRRRIVGMVLVRATAGTGPRQASEHWWPNGGPCYFRESGCASPMCPGPAA